jgi:hypothetical protein
MDSSNLAECVELILIILREGSNFLKHFVTTLLSLIRVISARKGVTNKIFYALHSSELRSIMHKY